MPYFPPVGGSAFPPNSVGNDSLTDMAQGTVKGRASGAGTGDPQDLTPAQLGQILSLTRADCRFDYASTSVCRLSRFGGMLLTIDNTLQIIPTAGVDLGLAGLSASTTYLVYAYMNAGVMTLEASTTGNVPDSRNGMMVKSGDATRTLVGIIYTNTGPAFAMTNVFMGVRGYYNRRPWSLYANGSPSTASGTWVAMFSPHIFTAWDDDLVTFSAGGYVAVNVNYGVAYLDMNYDGGGVGLGLTQATQENTTVNVAMPLGVSRALTGIASGAHSSGVSGLTTGGGTAAYTLWVAIGVR